MWSVMHAVHLSIYLSPRFSLTFLAFYIMLTPSADLEDFIISSIYQSYIKRNAYCDI